MFIAITPSHQLCQMQVDPSKVEFLRTIYIQVQIERGNFVFACVRPLYNVKLGIFTS